MYVCVCVCVCIHTHTHTHTHIWEFYVYSMINHTYFTLFGYGHVHTLNTYNNEMVIVGHTLTSSFYSS